MNILEAVEEMKKGKIVRCVEGRYPTVKFKLSPTAQYNDRGGVTIVGIEWYQKWDHETKWDVAVMIYASDISSLLWEVVE